MYYVPHMYRYSYQYPTLVNSPMYGVGGQSVNCAFPSEVQQANLFDYPRHFNNHENFSLKDFGAGPFVININEATKRNNTFRTALWTGSHLQITLMSIGVGEDIGLEMHPHLDQFLRLEQGTGIVQMGKQKNNLSFKRNVYDDFAIVIPAGTWHNLTNTGGIPLKLYSIYAPPNHPFGTVHVSKAEAIAAEEEFGHNSRNTAFFSSYR